VLVLRQRCAVGLRAVRQTQAYEAAHLIRGGFLILERDKSCAARRQFGGRPSVSAAKTFFDSAHFTFMEHMVDLATNNHLQKLLETLVKEVKKK
jgi:hypothetical protein